jgi:type II secretory pathway pseudopilin PulG
MAALAILGIFLAGFFQTTHILMKQMANARLKSEAVALVAQKFDSLRPLDISTLPTTGSVGPEIVNGENNRFTILTEYCGDAALCSDARTRHIRVLAHYRGKEVYRAESVYTRLR